MAFLSLLLFLSCSCMAGVSSQERLPSCSSRAWEDGSSQTSSNNTENNITSLKKYIFPLAVPTVKNLI